MIWEQARLENSYAKTLPLMDSPRAQESTPADAGWKLILFLS